MKIWKYFIIACVCMAFAKALYADEDDGDISQYNEDLEERDWFALRDFLYLKRAESVAEKECNLTISGDVRFDWRSVTEEIDGVSLRGRKATIKDERISKNKFDAEFNLYVDYVQERGWAVAQLMFDNSAGIYNNLNCKDFPKEMHGSGTSSDLTLKKAFFGYNAYSDDCSTFDIEFGRRHLYHSFDSKVQFLSRFDGLLLTYKRDLGYYGPQFYSKFAAFVVDYKINHYAWVFETGNLDICNTGIDLKYSFIYWKKNGLNGCCIHSKDDKEKDKFIRNPVSTNFMISQWTAYYHVNPEYTCDRPLTFFGAFLWNHDALKLKDKKLKEEHIVNNIAELDGNYNLAWYAGLRYGKVVEKDDWAVGVMYQWVEALAVPDPDSSGIGTGNIQKDRFFTDGMGNTNYKGWRFEGLYAVTDNWSFDARLEWSTDIAKVFDPDKGKRVSHNYSQFKIETIYAF